MKNKFFEYYILSDKEHIENIWNDSLIALDANVLLNLYRYSEGAKRNLLEVLEHYKTRLWIPYQVGWEYHQNRISVGMEMDEAYDQLATAIGRETDELIKKLNLSKYRIHPKIEIKQIEDHIISSTKTLRNQILAKKNSKIGETNKDEINDRITKLFDGKVGDDFDENKLKELYKEGQMRYNEKIPPGYCDANNKKNLGNRHLYGDLILWYQVIKEALEKKKNVILVTDDVKEDWFERTKGKTTGPRKELIREFRDETQMDILIYPTLRFLEYAKENMSVAVNQETIAEADEIHRENEAIEEVISSVPDKNKGIASKIVEENPWISAEYLSNTMAQLPWYNAILPNNPNPEYSNFINNPSNPFSAVSFITQNNTFSDFDCLNENNKDLYRINPLSCYSALNNRKTGALNHESLARLGLPINSADWWNLCSPFNGSNMTTQWDGKLGKNNSPGHSNNKNDNTK